jgi:(2Fe-2S) ferredoxin
MARFQHHVFICENDRPADHPKGCCHARGGPEVRKTLKRAVAEAGLAGTVRCSTAGCLAACEHGPAVVIYPEGVWYRVPTPADAEEVVREHLVGGRVVERLLIRFDEP